MGSKDLSSIAPARATNLVNSDGTYFQMTRPNYVGLTQVDVTTLGLVGDGSTDNAKALQAALTQYANKGRNKTHLIVLYFTKLYYFIAVLFFPHGIYNLESTVIVPPGSRLVGQVQ